MSVEHPVDRGGQGRGWFDTVAERVSNVASSPLFFSTCSTIVLIWALSYALGWPEGLRAFLGDLLAAITLVLVALLKNAERRAEHTVQFKLDAIAQALLVERDDGDDRTAKDLDRAIGRHEDV